MKKLFSFIAIALIAFMLTGCDGLSVRKDVETPLITFVIYTPEGVLEETIVFEENTEETLFDMLLALFDVEYVMFSVGNGESPMLLRIETLDSPYGSFISIDINGNFAMQGIDDLPFAAGDVIAFRRAWYDADAQAVYEGIESFKANQHVETYLYILAEAQPEIVLALGLVGMIDDVVDENGTRPYGRSPETISDFIKSIFINKGFGMDVADLAADLEDIAAFGWPYMNALMMLALHAGDGPADDTLKDDFIADMSARNLSTIDLDTLSIVLLALSLFEGTEIDALKRDIIDIIARELYQSAYGNNAATFAHVILALISMGENPRDPIYQYEGTTLVSLFLEHLQEDGTFVYQIGDAHADLMFSTPQGFLALASLHAYFNTGQPVNPYRFD